MSIQIRIATVEDIDGLVRLNAIVQQAHVDQRPDQFVPVAPLALAAWFRELLPRPSCHAWLAASNSIVVGYLLSMHNSREATPFSPPRTWLELDQIGVDGAYRNQGVGTALLLHAVAFARANQIQQVELVTWAFNTSAQSLFRKLGFVPKLSRFELPSDPTNNWREKTDAKTEVRLAR